MIFLSTSFVHFHSFHVFLDFVHDIAQMLNWLPCWFFFWVAFPFYTVFFLKNIIIEIRKRWKHTNIEWCGSENMKIVKKFVHTFPLMTRYPIIASTLNSIFYDLILMTENNTKKQWGKTSEKLKSYVNVKIWKWNDIKCCKKNEFDIFKGKFWLC